MWKDNGATLVRQCELTDDVVAVLVPSTGTKQTGAPRGERLYIYLRVESFRLPDPACSRRKIVSPSFIRSRRSRAIVSR
jgi:hypothetical protein